MSKYSVVKIGSRQFKVAEGDEIEVDRIDGQKGSRLIFDQVLLVANAKKVKIGQPFVTNVKVKAKILNQYKGKKVRVATFKAKSRYRRVKGFRPQLTLLKIEKIA